MVDIVAGPGGLGNSISQGLAAAVHSVAGSLQMHSHEGSDLDDHIDKTVEVATSKNQASSRSLCGL